MRAVSARVFAAIHKINPQLSLLRSTQDRDTNPKVNCYETGR